MINLHIKSISVLYFYSHPIAFVPHMCDARCVGEYIRIFTLPQSAASCTPSYLRDLRLGGPASRGLSIMSKFQLVPNPGLVMVLLWLYLNCFSDLEIDTLYVPVPPNGIGNRSNDDR